MEWAVDVCGRQECRREFVQDLGPSFRWEGRQGPQLTSYIRSPTDKEQFAFMAGTTANAVTVGLTQTEAVMNCPPEAVEGFKKEFLPMQSLPKFGQPEDVADVVSLLCSRRQGGLRGRW